MSSSPEIETKEKKESAAVLLSAIVTDARKLVELEIKLLHNQIKGELGRLERRALTLAVAVVLLFPAIFFIGEAAADCLTTIAGLSPWISKGIVGLLFGVPIVYLVVKGKGQESDVGTK